jgi:hypothetical protein
MLNTLILQITFDDSVIPRAALTDGLNDWQRALAAELKLERDPDSGGYEGYDWAYFKGISE